MMFVLLVAAPAQSFAQASNAKTPSDDKSRDEAAPKAKSRDGDTAGQQQPALSESQVLAKLHAANQMEMEAGGLAASRAQSGKVKRYGEQLIKDHRQADNSVMALAKRKGVDLQSVPSMPSRPSGESEGENESDAHAQRSSMEQLRTLTGSEFDRAFLAMMVADHDDALRLVRNARSQTQDPELRALLAKLTPVLRQHYDLAQRLLRTGESS
jgi:putative membrane protein